MSKLNTISKQGSCTLRQRQQRRPSFRPAALFLLEGSKSHNFNSPRTYHPGIFFSKNKNDYKDKCKVPPEHPRAAGRAFISFHTAEGSLFLRRTKWQNLRIYESQSAESMTTHWKNYQRSAFQDQDKVLRNG